MKRTIYFFSLTLIGLIYFFPEKSYAQANIDTSLQFYKHWKHDERLKKPMERNKQKYNRITGQAIFTSKMSDDEMAGIELWRGGRNLKMSFSFEMVGFAAASTASWLPQLIIGKKYKGNMKQQDVILIIGAVSGGFFVTALCELISGYNKIGNAGIIFQHKKFRIKTNGNNISMDL